MWNSNNLISVSCWSSVHSEYTLSPLGALQTSTGKKCNEMNVFLSLSQPRLDEREKVPQVQVLHFT